MTPKQLAGVVVALLVGLLCRLVLRVSPRVGVRLVRWAAGLRYRQDPQRAAMRAEELGRLVEDRPGRLLKLLTGLGFALHALAVAGLGARSDRRRLVSYFLKRPVPNVVGLGVTLVMWVAWIAVQWWVPRVVPVAKATAWWTGDAAMTYNPQMSPSPDLTGPLTAVGIALGLVVEVVVGLVAAAVLLRIAPARTQGMKVGSLVGLLPATQVGATAGATASVMFGTAGALVLGAVLMAVAVRVARVRARHRTSGRQ